MEEGDLGVGEEKKMPFIDNIDSICPWKNVLLETMAGHLWGGLSEG